MTGVPVVIATNGYGMAVRPVDSGAPVMTVAENGFGMPIVISDLGAPFVVEGLGGFSPLTLFSSGEQGIVLDPSDLSTLYQDAAGSTPGAVGQPVGLVLGKEKQEILGPDLVTNGTFDTDIAGWTQIGGGSAVWDASGAIACSDVGGADCNVAAPITTVVGRWYRVSWTVRSSNGLWLFRIRNATDLNFPGVGIGSFSGVFTASAVSNTVNLLAAGTNSTTVFDNISVREVLTVPASQPTAAARPTLGRHPVGGRRNLLTATEDFNNSGWIKVGGSVAADLFSEDGATSAHGIDYSATVGAGVHTVTFEFQSVGRRWVRLDPYGAASPGSDSVWFDLVAGVKGAEQPNCVGDIEAIGDGWYRCSWTATCSAGSLTVSVRGAADDNVQANYAGLAGPAFRIRKPQLELGPTATPYQKVVSAYDVTEAGKTDCWYLETDGVDDFLVTPSIDFTSSDKVTVFAAVEKLSDAATGVVVEGGVDTGTVPGSFAVVSPRSNSAGDYGFRARGSVLSPVVGAAGFVAPHMAVLTGIGDIGNDLSILEIDGTEVARSTADQGTGTFGNYPLYIGRRGGSSLPAKMRLYGLIIVQGVVDAETRAKVVNYLKAKQGRVA